MRPQEQDDLPACVVRGFLDEQALDELVARYPLLHQPDRWGWASITMRFTTRLPPEALVASTHVVGFVGDEVLLCRNEGTDLWFHPGGTREPGESVDDSLARELHEEAGARLLGPFHRLGAHVGVSDATHPYRAHLPHPEKAWLWGWAEVAVVGPPTNPADGEQVAEVRTFGLQDAAALTVRDNPWGGELIRFAAERRERGSAVPGGTRRRPPAPPPTADGPTSREALSSSE